MSPPEPLPSASADPKLRCSFCGARQRFVRYLVQSPHSLVCDGCAHAFSSWLARRRPSEVVFRRRRLVRANATACSFCAAALDSASPRLVSGRAHALCEPCLGLVDGILLEVEAAKRKAAAPGDAYAPPPSMRGARTLTDAPRWLVLFSLAAAIALLLALLFVTWLSAGR